MECTKHLAIPNHFPSEKIYLDLHREYNYSYMKHLIYHQFLSSLAFWPKTLLAFSWSLVHQVYEI